MSEEDVRALDALIRHPPFHAWLGVNALDARSGYAKLGIPPNPEFVGNPFIPAIHGGIIAALIDLAGGAALFVELRFPTPTIDMRIDYLRPAIAGRSLTAEAHVKRLGKTVAFVDVDVWQDDGGGRAPTRGPSPEPPSPQGRLVATGRCAYSVKDREAGPRGFPIG